MSLTLNMEYVLASIKAALVHFRVFYL